MIAYAIALVVAFLMGYAVMADGALNTITIVFMADLAGTAVIFGFSRAFHNSSFYDPYWSVAPPLIALFWALTPMSEEVSILRRMLVVSLVAAWGIRLTYNWMRKWEGLPDEDWRYRDFREKWGERFWLMDLLGIHFFPTLQVFIACLSLYPALSAGTRAVGWLDFVALAVTGGAIVIEMVADRQLYDFIQAKTQPGGIMVRGLWAYSRHPNYFGEMLFWWGLYLFGLAANPSFWWTVIGPIVITLMFRLVSIPLLDDRNLASREGYAEHMQRVNACIPWFREN